MRSPFKNRSRGSQGIGSSPTSTTFPHQRQLHFPTGLVPDPFSWKAAGRGATPPIKEALVPFSVPARRDRTNPAARIGNEVVGSPRSDVLDVGKAQIGRASCRERG